MPKDAALLQIGLAKKLKLKPILKKPQFVCGLDCAINKAKSRIFAAAVVVDISAMQIVEQQFAEQRLSFPYVPGLLSFREAPCYIEALEKLSIMPDAIIVDGQGYAHPRRLGLACHIGLMVNVPTVGCAKSRLVGEFKMPGSEKECRSKLMHNGELVGYVYRSKKNVKPLYVSPGNNCTFDDAVKIVKVCLTKYRLPEPSRLAHQLAGRRKTLLSESGIL